MSKQLFENMNYRNAPVSMLVEDGIIKKIIEKKTMDDVDSSSLDNWVNFLGNKVVPSFIDMHAHFRDPGFTYKEDLESGMKAAMQGGFSTVCAMANTNPVIDNKTLVENNRRKIKDLDLIDVMQVCAVTENFGDSLVDFESIKGTVPFFSNDGKNIDDESVMREALRLSKELGFIVATHNEPETETVVRDIALLKETGGNLHVCHVSKKDTIEAIIEAKKRGLNITCEVTPHHLYFSELDFKVHPPFRSEEDRKSLIKAIKDNLIDVISTDHAPHSKEDKLNGSPGLINFQSAYGSLNKVFNEEGIPGDRLVEMMSENPARILGLNSGVLEEGKEANFNIVNPDEEWVFKEEDIVSKSKNTPFIGENLKGKVLAQILRGNIIYSE